MSREVRRVPVGWKHPVEPDPYWRRNWRMPAPRLHQADERFVPLYRESYSVARAEWERGRAEWEAGTHEHLAWLLRYHSADGYVDRDGTRHKPQPYVVFADDDEDTVLREFFPETVAEILAVYPYSEYDTEPTPETHMPDFAEPADELGWCLYETVSEGTPVTPVFATAEELVEHLCTVGQDWDQVPLRREAAETIVRRGGTVGSLVMVSGHVYRSTEDADTIARLL